MSIANWQPNNLKIRVEACLIILCSTYLVFSQSTFVHHAAQQQAIETPI